MDKRTFTKAQELFRRLTWLEEIAQAYEDGLKTIGEEGSIVTYTYRDTDGDVIFTRQPIKPRFVIDGLENALADIKAEIEDIKKKIAAL